MPPTKERALQAALELLGEAGIRALTHARVDTQAQLPKGSTSNFFRTRTALLVGTVQELAAREATSISGLLPPESEQGLLDVLCSQFRQATTQDHVLSTARFALLIEGVGHPEVRAAIAAGRVGFEQLIAPLLERLGALEPEVGANALMSAYEGMLLYHLARGAGPDPRPTLSLVLAAILPQSKTFTP